MPWRVQVRKRVIWSVVPLSSCVENSSRVLAVATLRPVLATSFIHVTCEFTLCQIFDEYIQVYEFVLPKVFFDCLNISLKDDPLGKSELEPAVSICLLLAQSPLVVPAMSSQIFDVDDRGTDNLAFQGESLVTPCQTRVETDFSLYRPCCVCALDFGSSRISPDVPTGRISPSASPHVRASAGLFETEQRFHSTINGATKSGGLLNLDFCTSC